MKEITLAIFLAGMVLGALIVGLYAGYKVQWSGKYIETKEIQRYIKIQGEANIAWARIIAIKEAELTGETETKFARERRESDEAAFERKREFAEEEEERFEDIRKESDERREKIQEERDLRTTEELEFESEFFRLIREKRFDEAEKLQEMFIKKLRGG